SKSGAFPSGSRSSSRTTPKPPSWKQVGLFLSPPSSSGELNDRARAPPGRACRFHLDTGAAGRAGRDEIDILGRDVARSSRLTTTQAFSLPGHWPQVLLNADLRCLFAEKLAPLIPSLKRVRFTWLYLPSRRLY